MNKDKYTNTDITPNLSGNQIGAKWNSNFSEQDGEIDLSPLFLPMLFSSQQTR